MKTCAAASCTNTSYNSPYLTWHSLPYDIYVRDDWVELLGIPDDDDDVDPPKVCSTHFRPSDFQANNRLLKPNARPSLRLAKTAKPVHKDKTDLEDYVASESDEENPSSAAVVAKPEPTPPVSTRPSRKAAQKAAEKLKRYCYASPPASPPSPGSPSEDSPSTSRAQSSKSSHYAQQRSTPVMAKPVRPSYNNTINKGQNVSVLRGNFMKYTPTRSPYVGVNVTQVPLKPPSEDVQVQRRCPIFERTGVHITLQMECYEELLTPAQVSKHQKMEADAASFNHTLRTLRASNVTIIHHTDPFVKVTNTVTMVTSQLTNGVGGNSLSTKTTDALKSTPIQSTTTQARPKPIVIAQASQPVQVIKPAGTQQAILLNKTNIVVPAKPKPAEEKTTGDPKSGSGPNASADLSQDGCVFSLEGGDKEVTAETLLGIKSVSGSYSKWCKLVTETKSILETELDKENFFNEPVRWMLKMNLIVAENSCRSCTQGKYCLVPDSNVQDGFKWLCNKARCAKILPVQRLYFFSRFGCSLSRLLPLVFHWAVQTDIHDIKSMLRVDIYVIRSVWRALQEVCTRSVVNKAKKLGGPGKVVEVVTAKIGQFFWVIAAMERKPGLVRMKVVRAEPDWNVFTNLQKILEPWLMYKTVIMSPERALRGMGRIGYVFTLVDKNPQQNQGLIHAQNVTKYVKSHLTRMFSEFKLADLKLDTIQGFLDELQWRNRFGKTPRDSFCYIFKDIAEQSGRVVSFPPSDFVSGAASGTTKVPPEVTLSSDNSASGESDNESGSVDTKKPASSSSTETKKTSLKTYGKGSGSNSSSSSTTGDSSNKQKMSSEASQVVVLDRYYYAVKQPDKEVDVETVNKNFQFKCYICQKVIDNNLKVMKHMVAHIEENRNRNPDLSDLTQCKYCFRDFDTPFSMQCHMESVHLNTSALSCQICNQAFNTSKELAGHMKWTHVKAEMPYNCQVCNYRSSFHRDVLEHFQVAHNNTDKLLCHYCLRVYIIRFHGPEQLGQLQNFYYHLHKHQGKSTNKKCNACCLVFPTPNDFKKHKTIDHVSFAKEKGITYGSTKPGQEVIMVKDPQIRNAPSKKSTGRVGRPPKYQRQGSNDDDEEEDDLGSEALAALAPARGSDNSTPVTLSEDFTGYSCLECKNPIDPDHFTKSVSCSRCVYATYCSKAFVEHMISEHSQLEKKRPSVFTFSPLQLTKPRFCPCGFQSSCGNKLANHLKTCGRKSCYTDWMKAVSSLVKVEPESQQSMERGSAFFPPLVVLDQNEEEYVNQTLSTIPEPVPGVKPVVPGRRKRSRDSQDQPEEPAASTSASPVKKVVCDSEGPSWLNALGLVRRSDASGPADTDSTSALSTKERVSPPAETTVKREETPRRKRLKLGRSGKTPDEKDKKDSCENSNEAVDPEVKSESEDVDKTDATSGDKTPTEKSASPEAPIEEGSGVDDESQDSRDTKSADQLSKDGVDKEEDIGDGDGDDEMSKDDVDNKVDIDDPDSGDKLSKDDIGSKDGIDEDIDSKDGVDEDIGSKDGVDEDIGSKDGVDEDIGSKDGVDEDIGSKDGVDEDIGSKDGVDEDVGSKDGVDEDIGSKNGVDKDIRDPDSADNLSKECMDIGDVDNADELSKDSVDKKEDIDDVDNADELAKDDVDKEDISDVDNGGELSKDGVDNEEDIADEEANEKMEDDDSEHQEERVDKEDEEENAGEQTELDKSDEAMDVEPTEELADKKENLKASADKTDTIREDEASPDLVQKEEDTGVQAELANFSSLNELT